MAVYSIPTFADPFYTFSTTLEGRDYVFDFRFNQREGAWYFSVLLPDGTELASGIKVVCRKNLLKRAADIRLPPGILFAFHNGTDDSPPDLEELGEDRRVTLMYMTSDE